MSPAKQSRDKGVARFRTQLFTAMMVIVATLTGLGFYLAQQKVTADAERNLQQSFQAELSSMHSLEELRHAALADRCDTLATKSRIHAAIEDNAIDLLYPSAKDELRDLMEGDEPPPEKAARSLHAKFYRFLDTKGAVIKPLNPSDVGELDAKTEAQLALDKLPDKQQIGYIRQNNPNGGGFMDEVIAVPIFSTDTGDIISALVIGFKPLEVEAKHAGMKSGIWANGKLHLPALRTVRRVAVRPLSFLHTETHIGAARELHHIRRCGARCRIDPIIATPVDRVAEERRLCGGLRAVAQWGPPRR